MTKELASLAQSDYFYLDPFWSVNLGTCIIKAVNPSGDLLVKYADDISLSMPVDAKLS